MGALTTGSRGSAPESWSSFPSCFDGAGVARKHGFTSSGSSSTGWRSPAKDPLFLLLKVLQHSVFKMQTYQHLKLLRSAF